MAITHLSQIFYQTLLHFPEEKHPKQPTYPSRPGSSVRGLVAVLSTPESWDAEWFEETPEIWEYVWRYNQILWDIPIVGYNEFQI